MPLVTSSSFAPHTAFSNPHLQTALGVILPIGKTSPYARTQVPTEDGEILCLDWLYASSSSLAVVCHGMEGSSISPYVRSLCTALHLRGWNVVACNMRGNGGEGSRTPTFSHAGSSGDLRSIINSIPPTYGPIVLIGFSLGGNIVLKYLGEEGNAISHRIVAGCVFSVPCDLASTAEKLANPWLYPYMARLLWDLKKRIDRLSRTFPGAIKPFSLHRLKTFRQFDDQYTAPLHGFRDASHYWSLSSSVYHLEGITVPTLIVNAKDDPFLDLPSFPVGTAARHKHVFLEVPAKGGHLGFFESLRQPQRWVNTRTTAFINEVLGKR